MAAPPRQDGHHVSGTLHNLGNQITGNNFAAGKDNIVNIFGGESASETERKKCLHALFLTDPADDRAKIMSFKGQAMSGTCDWLLENKAFREWLSRSNSSQLLWINGPPGAGKTMISVYLTAQLEKALPPNVTLLYYFCDASDGRRNDATHVLRGLIFSLVRQKPQLITHIIADFEVQQDALFNEKSLESLWRIMENMVADLPTVYCVIDGLDECNKASSSVLLHLLRKIQSFFSSRSGDVNDKALDVSEQLQKLMLGEAVEPPAKDRKATKAGEQSKQSSIFKMALISRNSPISLTRELSAFPQVKLGNSSLANVRAKPSAEQTSNASTAENITPSDIPATVQAPNSNADHSLESSHVEEDTSTGGAYSKAMTRYIDIEVEAFMKSTNCDESIKDVLTQKLLNEEANYLWVDMAIGQLKMVDPSTFESTIESLPQTVEDIYCNRLLGMPEDLVPTASFVIKWITMTFQPLSLNELATALATSNDQTFEVAHSKLTAAVEAFGNMIKINDNNEITLVHQTIHSFFTSESSMLLQYPSLQRFPVRESEAHAEMARTCIAYMQSGAMGTIEKPLFYRLKPTPKHPEITNYKHVPLIKYAILYWTQHLRLSNLDTIDLTQPFFNESILRGWWESWWILNSFNPDTTATYYSLLSIAAYFDLLVIAKQLERNQKLQQQLEPRIETSPLFTAATRGSLQVFSFLLSRNARTTRTFRHVLSVAAESGQLEVVRIVLDTGADPNILEIENTFMKGTLGVIRMAPGLLKILQSHAENEEDSQFMTVYERDTGGKWTPLLYAAGRGQDEVVKLLIERGANVGLTSSSGWAPLHCAAWAGSADITQLLLQNGGDLYAKNTEHWMPHHVAADRGKLDALKVLLPSGLNVFVNSPTKLQQTPLHLACANGHGAVTKYLLSAGANVEAKTLKGQTPLHLAIQAGSNEAVRALLEAGADRNAVYSGKTAIAQAQKSKNQEVAALLMSYHPVITKVQPVHQVSPLPGHIQPQSINQSPPQSTGHAQAQNVGYLQAQAPPLVVTQPSAVPQALSASQPSVSTMDTPIGQSPIPVPSPSPLPFTAPPPQQQPQWSPPQASVLSPSHAGSPPAAGNLAVSPQPAYTTTASPQALQYPSPPSGQYFPPPPQEQHIAQHYPPPPLQTGQYFPPPPQQQQQQHYHGQHFSPVSQQTNLSPQMYQQPAAGSAVSPSGVAYGLPSPSPGSQYAGYPQAVPQVPGTMNGYQSLNNLAPVGGYHPQYATSMPGSYSHSHSVSPPQGTPVYISQPPPTQPSQNPRQDSNKRGWVKRHLML